MVIVDQVEELLADFTDCGKDKLIPMLQVVQEKLGYVPTQAMEVIAKRLHVKSSDVYAVATFYNQFRLCPLGAHVIEVCRGTACHVQGSAKLETYLRKTLKTDANGNSPDGKFTLITVACMGACSIAPVIKIDGEFYGRLNVEKLEALLAKYREEQA